MPHYDVIIRNGTLVDGTGGPAQLADIGISGDRIAAIGAISGTATTELDASGLTISPGFIDVHTHAGRTIFQVPTADNYVRQGVTTIMEGADHCDFRYLLDGGAPLAESPSGE